MDRAQVAQWLQAYIDAWRSNDAAKIRALFTDDAEYRYLPFEQPLIGAEAIAASWLEDPDDPATWEATYEPVAVEGDTAVAVGVSRYEATADQPARTYANCFVLRFAGDGRCRALTEWFVQEPSTPDAG